ncbi:hypothetical protein VEE27_30910 [Escherichia coli]|nr:hypothetical protein VEE27_30910 [Escherichia coli]
MKFLSDVIYRTKWEAFIARRITYLFISHDLHVVRALCHQVIILRQGEVVEQGPCARVFATPQQEYTRQLLALS